MDDRQNNETNGNGASPNEGDYSPKNDEQYINGACEQQYYWVVSLENLPRIAEELTELSQ